MNLLRYEFDLPAKTYDLNKAAMHKHWGPRKAYVDKVHAQVKQMASEGLIELPDAPIELAEVRYHFILPRRGRRDPENLAGVAKPYMDALVKIGVMQDDSWENIYPLIIYADYIKGVKQLKIQIRLIKGRALF